jgi:hypothetical protein
MAACRDICGEHIIAYQPMWQREESQCQQVVVKFDHDSRKWPAGASNTAWENLFRELGGETPLIIAMDGYFCPES